MLLLPLVASLVIPWLPSTAHAECRGIPSTLLLDWGSVPEKSDRNDASATMRRNATGETVATVLGRATCEASDGQELDGFVERCLYCLEDGVAYSLQLVDRYGDGWKEGTFSLYVDEVLVLQGSQERGDKECGYDVDSADAPCATSSFRYFVAEYRHTPSPTEARETVTVEIDWRDGKFSEDRLTASAALRLWSSPPAARLLTPSMVYDGIRGHQRNTSTSWLEFEINDSLVLAADYDVAPSGKLGLELRETSGLLSGWNGGLARVSLSGKELTSGTVVVGTSSTVLNFTLNHTSFATASPTPRLAPLVHLWLVIDWTADDRVEGASVQMFRVEGPPYRNGFRNDSDLLLRGQYLVPVQLENGTTLGEVIPQPSQRQEYAILARSDDILMLRVACWPQEPWSGGFVQLLNSSKKQILFADGTDCNRDSGYRLDIEVPLLVPVTMPSWAPSASMNPAGHSGGDNKKQRFPLQDQRLAFTLAVVFTGMVALAALCMATFVLVRFMRPASPGFARSARHVTNPMMSQDDPLDDARLVDYEDELDYESSEPYRDDPSLVHSEVELQSRSRRGREPRRPSPRPVTLVNLSPASPIARAPSRSFDTPRIPASANRAQDFQPSPPTQHGSSPFNEAEEDLFDIK